MLKIKKDNVIYRIDKEYANNFLARGFEIVEDLTVETPKGKAEAEIMAGRTLLHMRKLELKDLAELRGLKLSGEETINELRALLK